MRADETPKDQQDALRLLARHYFHLRAEERHLVRLVALARKEGTPWHLIGRVLGISRQAAMKRYHGVPDEFDDLEGEQLALELDDDPDRPGRRFSTEEALFRARYPQTAILEDQRLRIDRRFGTASRPAAG